jgi:hypothetical protein
MEDAGVKVSLRGTRRSRFQMESTCCWTGTTCRAASLAASKRALATVGPDWSEERDVVRAGMERLQGADMLRSCVNRADMGRGPIWAAGIGG